jgi:subtilisin family serine protease
MTGTKLSGFATELSTATGAGVRVAVIDSGVECSHEALRLHPPRCWTLETTGPKQYRLVEDDGVDVFGHGTAVASIIGEFAPGAAIESVRVLGGDLRSSSDRAIAALQWAIDQRFDVINCSFGTPHMRYLEMYKRIVDQAFCDNVLVVSACNNVDARTIALPGWFPTVIAADHGALAPLTLQRRAGEMVEFVARGRQVRVPWNRGGWREVTGSSFAAPHVSAIVARLREIRPSWNACEVKTALYSLASAVAVVTPAAR